MSRDDVLVSADWVERTSTTPEVVLVEVDEDTSAYDTGHIRARQARLEERPAGPGPPRLRQQGAVRGAAVRARASATTTRSCSTAATTTGSPPTRTGTSSSTATSDVRLLDGGRKKWELDRRELATRSPTRAGDDVHGQGAGPVDPRVPRRGRRGDRQEEPRRRALAPTSSPAGCSPRRTCRRSRRSGPVTSRPRSTSRGPRPPTRTAPSGPTTSSQLYAEAGVDSSQGHHRVLPHRRALLAHLVRPARAARPAEREELRRILDRVRLAGRRAGRARRRARGGLTCAEPPQGGLEPRGCRRRQGDGHPGRRASAAASRSAARTSGCWTDR